MLKLWALVALMLAVKSATSDDKWTFYKAEYSNKERRCLRGTCDLGPHAYRGMNFQGPAWSVKFFFEDPQLIIESPWYNRIRREAPADVNGEPARLVDILHEELGYRSVRNATNEGHGNELFEVKYING